MRPVLVSLVSRVILVQTTLYTVLWFNIDVDGDRRLNPSALSWVRIHRA